MHFLAGQSPRGGLELQVGERRQITLVVLVPGVATIFCSLVGLPPLLLASSSIVDSKLLGPRQRQRRMQKTLHKSFRDSIPHSGCDLLECPPNKTAKAFPKKTTKYQGSAYNVQGLSTWWLHV